MSPASTTARVTASHPAGEGLEGLVLSDTYLLGDILARGGMGVLYAAEHTRLRTPLVVKVLRQRYASHPIARARFEREALATARLDAPHVLRVVDLVETPDGRPAVVTERLTGEDLQQHLSRRKTLPVPLALDIVRQVLRGLEAAHAAHVIHRDIKPSNIFLSPSEGSPHVRVLDFGVAKLEDAAGITKAGAVVGTPAYMPPEQAAGRPVDARGDVYSTGAVLYRMLSGRSPYSGDADSVLRSVLSGPPAPLAKVAPELPEKVSALVERAMMRDPEARFASASEMLRAIDAIEPSGAKPVAKRSLPRVRSYQRARLRGGLTLAHGSAVRGRRGVRHAGARSEPARPARAGLRSARRRMGGCAAAGLPALWGEPAGARRVGAGTRRGPHARPRCARWPRARPELWWPRARGGRRAGAGPTAGDGAAGVVARPKRRVNVSPRTA
jgi:serine/threonine protein kinase